MPSTHRALVVDADEGVRESVAAFLGLLGCDVTLAVDGVDALEHLQRHALPHVIVLDLAMSRMDGLSFRAHQLADATLATIPVIVLSAHDALDRHVALFRGVRWLRKPFRADELRDAVNAILHI
jgi:CheY-like chemotaxis protein